MGIPCSLSDSSIDGSMSPAARKRVRFDPGRDLVANPNVVRRKPRVAR
jgi:hypothetical protein